MNKIISGLEFKYSALFQNVVISMVLSSSIEQVCYKL